MEKNKVKGFVTGVLCTVLVGGGIFGGRYVLSNKDHAVNQESVQKAKAIESLIDKYYLDKIDKVDGWTWRPVFYLLYSRRV